MLENDTLVKHRILGFEGLIDGHTKMKLMFTGDRNCDYQYRVKIFGQEKRFVAPEEDLVEIADKEREKELQGMFKKAKRKLKVAK